jgi:RNA polymerase sigma factor (sigma-70 family)
METGKALGQPSGRAAPEAAAPIGFEAFYRAAYRELLKTAMYAGATEQEAEDATQKTMEEAYRRWSDIDHPHAYARRAVISNFLKDITRGHTRTRRRQTEREQPVNEGGEDTRLTMWEDRQWVTQLLKSLPPAQREVMAFIFDGFTPGEVAELLGKTPGAVRQNLCEARRRLTLALHEQHEAEQRMPQTPSSAKEVPQ